MKNEAKSIEIASKVADGYGIDFEPLAEATLDMADWKDQQFKEYLEKKQSELDGTRNKSNYELLDEIINELFKEKKK